MSSVDTGAPEASNTFYIVVISCVATIGGFLFGFDSGVINIRKYGGYLVSIESV